MTQNVDSIYRYKPTGDHPSTKSRKDPFTLDSTGNCAVCDYRLYRSKAGDPFPVYIEVNDVDGTFWLDVSSVDDIQEDKLDETVYTIKARHLPVNR